MGVSRCVYLGPFLECKPRVVEGQRAVRCCAHRTCTRFGREVRDHGIKYCPECGCPMGHTMQPTRLVGPHWAEVSEAVREALAIVDQEEDEVHRWIPNARRDGAPRGFSVPDHSSVALTDFDPFSETAWFAVAFAAECETLRRLYGPTNVAVRWGLLQGFE